MMTNPPWAGWVILAFVVLCTIGTAQEKIAPVNAQVTGCFTANCHGSNSTDGPAWSRAAATWLIKDPHAHAYSTLMSQWSIEIVAKLSADSIQPSDRFAFRNFVNDRCATCHATAGQPEVQLLLGVECQSCHGPTSAWDASHWNGATSSPSTANAHSKQRIDLRNLETRVTVCTTCHIGDLNRPQPLEVNHELIAAGHPPMYFEFESLWQRMPEHWASDKDIRHLGDTAPFQRWRAGVLLGAAARMQMLAVRLDRADSVAALADLNARQHIWPELAEFSCFDCHHERKSSGRSWSQSSKSSSKAKWDGWTRQAVALLAISSIAEEPHKQLKLISSQFDALASHLEKPLVNSSLATRVREFGSGISDQYRQLAAGRPPESDELRTITQRLLAGKTHSMTWEAAVQWRMELAALCESLKMTKLPQHLIDMDSQLFGLGSGVRPVGIRTASEPSIASPARFEPSVFESNRLKLIEIFSQDDRR